MQRILLISDTHGKLDVINELVERTNAQMVIHAGDFGFYDTDSVERLSNRELRLLIVHSPAKDSISQQTSREELIEIVLKKHLLGDFPEYRSGKKRFSVPIYTVWGNHEDIAIIEKLRGGHSINNLMILDENQTYEMDGFQLFGIGGNFLAGRKLFGQPLSGQGGKVWSTLHQYGALYQRIRQEGEPSIFVSHVSPGKEPLLARLISHFKPKFWVSGHMGTPYTCVWNQYTVREEKDAFEWLNLKVKKEEQNLTEEARLALDLINGPLPDKTFWLKQPWNINLPDAKDGHALLIINNGRFTLETFSRG
ncbi:MAG: hypothetical protein K940chlam7_01365 [Chlamydiae bacterium]|nr:hypothetical protein [Chlamydiota bacterium]